jgi:hypothetical protein
MTAAASDLSAGTCNQVSYSAHIRLILDKIGKATEFELLLHR